jgi:rSAM/selenodomain-associated transferase 2
MTSAAVGIVVPALNEAAHLDGILSDVRAIECVGDVLVVDGGSSDGTVELARSAGARVITAARGRGQQLNAGARAVAGDWLCFLHADVRMPRGARDALPAAVADERVSAAVWRFAVDAGGLWFRLIELGAWIRDRIGGLTYGDQGLLVRRSLYEAVGGFPEIPVMEDVAMIRALKRRGVVHHLDASLVVSARRWEREGPFKTWIRNALLVTAYLGGVPPKRLVRWYRPEAE